jgi:hypothetical protein
VEVKCQVCGKKNEKSEMKKITTGKKTKTNKYYHPSCHQKHLKEKEFKQQEWQELDDLCELIKSIHGIESIPKQLFPDLQALRNGDVLYGKVKKKYKNGVKFRGIFLTYQYCADQIRYWKNKKEFKNTLSELRYGLAIVRNSVDDARNDYRKKQKAKEEKQTLQNHMDMMKDVKKGLRDKSKETNNKKENNKTDVTSLFD